MSRTIVISDIHGCLEPLDRLLEHAAFDFRRDRLILLGDYVDRGPDSKQVVDRVIELVLEKRAIALRGNHDQRLVDFVKNSESSLAAKFLEHGGGPTLLSYCPFIDGDLSEDALRQARLYMSKNYAHHLSFLSELPLYHEDPEHIYVHAGIHPSYSDWKTQPDDVFMYVKNDFIRSKTNVKKIVVFGHTRTVEIHGVSDIWFGGDKIGIDGGYAYGMQLNALIMENGAYRTMRVRDTGKSF